MRRLSQTTIEQGFRPDEVPAGSVSMRPGAGIPGGQESIARKLLGDLVRGSAEPVIVRPVETGFEIIVGDIEYLAALRRGAKTIKVMVADLADKDALLLRLLEASRRGDLNSAEEAEIIRELNQEHGLTQQEIAMRCNKVQSTVANKMRLLKLPAEILQSLRRGEIGERHARALLKVEGTDKQNELFRRAMRMKASAAEVEAMSDLAAGAIRTKRGRGRSAKGLVRDIRIYQNSLRAVVREMKKAGLAVSCDEETSGGVWEFSVRIKTEDPSS